MRAGNAAGPESAQDSVFRNHQLRKGPTLTAALPDLAEGDFYYEVLGDGRFRSTIHAQGAWNEHEQHMAPASGIMADCLARHEPRDDMRMARLSYEILGLIPGGEFEVITTTLRPGRTIELLQAELVAGGTGGHPRHGLADDHLRHLRHRRVRGPRDPGPGGLRAVRRRKPLARRLHRLAADADRRGPPGRLGTVWLRTDYPLTDRADSSDLARLIGLVDTANGIAARVPPGKGSYAFPNLDLQIHMYRQPEGEWLGLDNEVSFGTDGIGLTSTVLHDLTGPFGRAEQILTLRKS